MPLFYYGRQSNIATKKGVKTWHVALKKVGRPVDLQMLAEEIAEKSSLTPGDVHNVIHNLMSSMRVHLLNSRSVRLNSLGTFTMIAHSRGQGVAKKEEVNANQVTSLICQFTPEYFRQAAVGTTRALLKGVEFAKWTGEIPEEGTEDEPKPAEGGEGGMVNVDDNPLG